MRSVIILTHEGDKIKEDEMGGAYNVYGKDEKSFQNFSLNI
jgi:hypothetical protein